MASRSFDDLDARYRDRFVDWHNAAEVAADCSLLITCTLRSIVEQDALYEIGRTKPGKKVTNAKAGDSAHNFGLALDFVPIVNGKPVWTDSADEWRRAGNLAPVYGLEWAGTWSSFREYPHIQVPDWRGLIP